MALHEQLKSSTLYRFSDQLITVSPDHRVFPGNSRKKQGLKIEQPYQRLRSMLPLIPARPGKMRRRFCTMLANKWKRRVDQVPAT
jgi:hypothetical protein